MKLLTWLWWHLPLSRERKEGLKTFVFSVFSLPFRNSRAFKNWVEIQKVSGRDRQKKTGKGAFENAAKETADMHQQPHPWVLTPIRPVNKPAIVIHAFYYDIFMEVMSYFEKEENSGFHYYITVPVESEAQVRDYFSQKSWPYTILVVENHGRDVLPFLQIAPLALADGHELLLKIHTKKSDHRQTASLWRKDLYTKLIKGSAVRKACGIFDADPTIGMLGPSGHIVPMSLYFGANAGTVGKLAAGMGVPFSILEHLNFVAGTMFYIRRQALTPLLSLALDVRDFEAEAGQVDGTMAHAIERAFSVSCCAAGLKLVDEQYDSRTRVVNVNKDHPFTW